MNADMLKLVMAIGGETPKCWDNYILPGLKSALLATLPDGGILRIFNMTRDQEYFITPHNHRYAFNCFVLKGQVDNILYDVRDTHQDYATHVALEYTQESNVLNESNPRWVRAEMRTAKYVAGDWYGMTSKEFHSIRFAKGTQVLFVENAPTKVKSECLVPYSDGRICNTFLWKDWMMEGRK